jgi:RNA polymerase sigma-32 factor
MAPKTAPKTKTKATARKKTARAPKGNQAETRPVEIVEPGESGDDILDILPDPDDLAATEGLTDAIRIPELIDPIETLNASDAKAVTASGTTTDPVTLYLAEIRRYPLLTKEQEHDLAIRYRESGDAKAAETLVTSNLRFVVKVAAEYSKFGAKLIDLIQEGNVGLMHAVKEFNPYKGNRLITYAVWWIRGYIQEYLMRQYSMVRIGTTQNQRKLFYRLQKEKDLLDSMGTEPTNALLSSRLGVSEEDVKTMTQRMSGRDVSLNQPLDEGSGTSLMDFEAGAGPGVDEEIGHAEEIDVLRGNIASLREKLNAKETYILENRILSDEPMTLQEIGDHYGITREAVRQLEARLIGRIKTAFVEKVTPHAPTDSDPDFDSDSE